VQWIRVSYTTNTELHTSGLWDKELVWLRIIGFFLVLFVCGVIYKGVRRTGPWKKR
jgi:hypothetical protein